MADESKRIIVDDDWKVEAEREKQRLAEETEKRAAAQTRTGPIGFLDLLNLIAMQGLVGLGGFASPTGEPIPPNLEAAKHFIDLLQVLDEKTKNNLTPEEKTMVDQTLYELRMRYVQIASAGGGSGSAGDLPGMGMPRATR